MKNTLRIIVAMVMLFSVTDLYADGALFFSQVDNIYHLDHGVIPVDDEVITTGAIAFAGGWGTGIFYIAEFEDGDAVELDYLLARNFSWEKVTIDLGALVLDFATPNLGKLDFIQPFLEVRIPEDLFIPIFRIQNPTPFEKAEWWPHLICGAEQKIKFLTHSASVMYDAGAYGFEKGWLVLYKANFSINITDKASISLSGKASIPIKGVEDRKSEFSGGVNISLCL